MSDSTIFARSAISAALAAAIALAISILCFAFFADMAMGSALLMGLGIAAVTFGLAWAGSFFMMRARTPRARATDPNRG